MRSLALVSALFLCVYTPALATVERVPLSETDTLALEIVVPPGWTAIKHPRSDAWNSHRAVVVAISNRSDESLCVTALIRDLPGGGREFRYGPEAFERALVPGTVYVDLAYAVGGPPPVSVPYAWGLDDQPAVVIQQALRESDPKWTTGGVVIHRAVFAHWGRHWDAIVAARKPFSKEDLERALSTLVSLRFPDTPVRDARQAVEVAIPALPAEFRESFREDPACGCCRQYDVKTSPIKDGFRVTFTLLDSQTRRTLRSMSVDVRPDGRTALLE